MTTEDNTTTVTETVTNVAVEVAKELAITVAGCGVALVLTAGIGSVWSKVQRRKSEKAAKSDTTN